MKLFSYKIFFISVDTRRTATKKPARVKKHHMTVMHCYVFMDVGVFIVVVRNVTLCGLVDETYIKVKLSHNRPEQTQRVLRR